MEISINKKEEEEEEGEEMLYYVYDGLKKQICAFLWGVGSMRWESGIDHEDKVKTKIWTRS